MGAEDGGFVENGDMVPRAALCFVACDAVSPVSGEEGVGFEGTGAAAVWVGHRNATEAAFLEDFGENFDEFGILIGVIRIGESEI